MRNIGELHEHAKQSLDLARSDTPRRDIVDVGSGGGGGGGTVPLTTCKILSAAGTNPPFIYSAEQVAHDGSNYFDPGHWVAVSGGLTLTGNLINVAESGTEGAGMAALRAGALVYVWAIAGGRYACARDLYRMTY